MLLLFTIYISDLKGFNIALGFLNTPENTYYAKSLVGFHSCVDEEENKIKYPITPQFLEHQIQLNLSDAQNIDDKYVLQHCSLIMTKNLEKKWRKYANPTTYLNIYSGKTRKTVKPFTQSPNGTLFFTNYTILIAKNSSPITPSFMVMPYDPVLIQNQAKINITFSIEFMKVEIPPKDNFKFPYLYLLLPLGSMFFVLMVRCVISSYFPNITLVDVVEAWKIPDMHSNYLLFSTTSLIHVFTLLFATFVKNDTQPLVYTFYNAYIFASFIPSLLRTIFDFVFQIPIFEPNYASTVLFPIIFNGIGFFLYLYIMKYIFGSHLTYGFLGIILIVLIHMGPFLIVRAISFLVYKSLPNTWQMKNKIKFTKLKYQGKCGDFLLNIIYNIVILCMSFQFYQHIIDIYLDAIPFNFELAWSTFLITTSAGMTYGAIQTLRDVKYQRFFMHSYFINMCYAFLFTTAYCIIEILANRKITQFLSLLRSGLGGCGAVGISIMIAFFAPFTTSFLIIFSIFRI